MAAQPCPVVAVSLWLGRWIGPGPWSRDHSSPTAGPWEGSAEPGAGLGESAWRPSEPALEETLPLASVSPSHTGDTQCRLQLSD